MALQAQVVSQVKQSPEEPKIGSFNFESDVRKEIYGAEPRKRQEYLTSETDLEEEERQMARRKACELIKENKPLEAIEILEPMAQTPSTLVLMIECCIQVDQLPEAQKNFEQLKDIMTSSRRHHVNDVIELFNQCQASGHTIRALCFVACASKLHSMDSYSDLAVVDIRNCSCTIDDVIRAVKTTKVHPTLLKFGLYLLNSVLKDLRAVEDANPAVKADMEARCLCDLGLISRVSGDRNKAKKAYKSGIRLMKKHFGSNAIKFQIYGHLHNNLAIIYRLEEKPGKALINYILCTKAYEQARDWESTFMKNKHVQNTNRNRGLLKSAKKKSRNAK